MFFAVVTLTLAVIASVHAKDFTLPKSLTSKKFFRNEQWTLAKPAAVQPSDHSLSSNEGSLSTLIAYQWPTNTECLGNIDIGGGLAQNICMTAYDVNGTPLGSGASRVTFHGPAFTNITYTEYSGFSCDGKVTYEEQIQYPTFCLADDSQAGTIRLQFTEATDMNHHFRNGLLISYYDTKDHCSSSSRATSFNWIALNYCIANDDGTSTRFVGCSNGQISVQSFQDSACTTLAFEGTVSTSTCAANTDGGGEMGSGVYYNSFYTHTCT